MKNKVIYIPLILSTIFLSCGKEDEEVKEIPRNVVYMDIEKSPEFSTKAFSGTIKGSTESLLSFRVAGNLNEKYVGLGSVVKKDEILASLDHSNYIIKLSEAKAELAKTKSQVSKAKADYQRYEELFLNDTVSKADYDNYKAVYIASLSQEKVSNEKLNLAQLNLSYTDLKAPFSGTIIAEFANVSENIKVGEPIFGLVLDSNLEVQIFLPEDFIGNISLNDPVSISVDAVKEDNIKGYIKEIGSGVTGIANTFPVKVSFDKPNNSIKSGMTAKVDINFKNKFTDKIIIPLSSLGEEANGKRYVFLAVEGENGSHVAKKTYVEAGEFFGNEIQIISGVTENDKIITAGVNYITDGQQIKLSDSLKKE